jgi:hypothetical protein
MQLVLSETVRLLSSEAWRTSTGIQNTFTIRTRKARLLSARHMLTAVVVGAGVTWVMGWLSTSPATGSSVPGPDVRAVAASAAFLFVLVVDGFGSAVRSRAGRADRFSDRFLPALGLHPAALAVRHTVRVILRGLLFSWVPLLPIHAEVLSFSLPSRVALLSAGLACSLTGDTIGLLSRSGLRWLGASFAAVGAVYWVALLPLMLVGRMGPTLALVPARALFLSHWNVGLTIACFAGALVIDFVASRWDSDHARRSARSGRAPQPVTRSRAAGLQVTGEAEAHVKAAIRRLLAWASQQRIATAVVWTYTLLPLLAIFTRLSRGPATLTTSQAVWPLAWGLGLPALACSEIMWGTVRRDLWALYRVNARSLYVPVVVPSLIALGVLSLWIVVAAAVLMITTAAAGGTVVNFVVLGLLIAVHCVMLQGCVGTFVVRIGADHAVLGRAMRYAGTVVGVLAPASLAMTMGALPMAAWVALVAVVAPAAAVSQLARTQFSSDAQAA